jgi:hypothetical protein
MPADRSVCSLCFEPAKHLHHLTGRDPNRDRLDPDLVSPLCVRHHVLMHNVLRSQHIDVAGRAPWTTPAESVAFRLLRLAVFFGLYADYHDDPTWPLVAVALRAWATELLADPTEKETQS